MLGSLLTKVLLPRLSYRAVSCIGSVLFGLGLLLSSLATSISVLYFTFGILVGVGSGLLHFAGIMVIPQFFRSQRGLAFGVALSGHGIGAVPIGYAIESFIQRFGLRIAFRLLALFALPLFAGSLVYGSKMDRKHKDTEDKSYNIKVPRSTKNIFKNKALWSHSIAMWVYAFGYYIPAVHLVNINL